MTHKQTANALMEAALWLGGRPDSEYWSIDVYNILTISSWLDDVDKMVSLRRELGGQWTKHTTEYEFSLTQSITENVNIKLSVSRNKACEPKVIGQETVEVPDYSNVPKKTVTRDIIEYDCKPILS